MTTLRRCFITLIALLIVGCGSDQPSPTSVPRATDAATEESAPTETAAPILTATPTEAAEPAGVTVRIKSVALGTYLIEDGAKVVLGEASDPTSEWLIEDYQGSKRIQNAETGHYIAIEHLLDHVEALDIEPSWMSPRWTFAGAEGGGTVLRNVWHNWEVLYVSEDGAPMYGRPPADPAVSEWLIELPEGGLLGTPTPMPEVSVPPVSGQMAERGALLPFIEYEAEDGRTNGEVLGPDRTFGTFAAESSGRQSVRLNEVGDYVQFTSTDAANSIVVRYSIPDSEDGLGLDATLSLYVNGTFRQKLNLTSKYVWSYGGEQYTYNTPAIGGEHHFFDEARALIDDVPAGATVRLQKDADDTAEYYVVDLIDLEQVAPPKSQPDGYLSLTEDCGAVADDGEDDRAALQACIDQAREAGTGVWIPVGTFHSTEQGLTVNDVTLQGAGMWYSVISGLYARFECVGNNCRYFDFAILGETIDRVDSSPENGFNGGAGTGSILENIWVEHTKVGYWVGPGTNGLIIRNSRFRNLFADGVNFCNGTSNSLIENSHFRNTGDDALASWSPSFSEGVNTGNVFRFNTVQLPWRANCFAIYGGVGNRIEDNICADVVTYPGIFIAAMFDAHPFGGETVIERNSLIRAGGSMFNLEHGALKIRANEGAIPQVIVRDLLIEGATFMGIEIEGSYEITGAVFENIEIVSPTTYGILIRSNAAGDVTFSNVSIIDAGKEGLLNYGPPNFFDLIKLAGNEGW